MIDLFWELARGRKDRHIAMLIHFDRVVCKTGLELDKMGATSNERTEIDNIDDRVTNNDSKRHVQLIARKGSMESPDSLTLIQINIGHTIQSIS